MLFQRCMNQNPLKCIDTICDSIHFRGYLSVYEVFALSAAAGNVRVLLSDVFQFTSRRVDGYPFSLTIYVNRQLHVRLSACCEAKRAVGARLGQGFFQLVEVKGAVPCIK